MKSTGFVELVLTCGAWQEAQDIADSLLAKRLVGCVEFLEVKSNEVKLIMESLEENFDKVEAAIAKLHSLKTFALQQIPLSNLSHAASVWLKDETTS